MDNDPRFVLPPSNNDGQNNSLIEFLSKSGHVAFHNQTHCISPATNSEYKPQKTEYTLKSGGSLGSFMNLIQGDETASWFPNPLDDSVESNFHEEFFGIQIPDPNVIDKENIVDICVKFDTTKDTNACMQSSLRQNSMMFPMNPQVCNSSSNSPSLENGLNFPHQTKLGREEMGSTVSNFGGVAIESSSHYQNNSAKAVVMENSILSLSKNSPQDMTFDPIISSPSSDSGSCLGKMGQQVMTNHDHKRKGRDADEDDNHIKNAEELSLEANKHAQKAVPLRRSRVAEVHNLSERRRRDKINEKMKALQDLIPYCNKPDKASMLDEAIEYLKSLQLQVQIMWMGGGMSPMVYPGVQPYKPCTGNGITNPPLHSIPSPVQSPGTALCNQFMPPISTPNRPFVCPSPGITPLNFTTQMPNARLPGPFSHYFGFPFIHMPTQVMDMYTYGPQVTQHNQTAAAFTSNRMPPLGTSSENIQNG